MLPSTASSKVLNSQAIDFIGGPGRTRTSNQAVMSR
jgi:hypothetical protein